MPSLSHPLLLRILGRLKSAPPARPPGTLSFWDPYQGRIMVQTRTDWQAVRDTIDLAEVAIRLLGPSPGRRGERGRRLWWPRPLGTHEDNNPSFSVRPGDRRWKCFGCGAKGDAMALVRRLNPSMSFPPGGGLPDRGTGPHEAADVPSEARRQ